MVGVADRPKRRGPKRAADPEVAFAYWYNEGDQRTQAATAEHFGVTVRAVERWSRADDWPTRAAALDLEARKALERQLARQAAKRLRAQLGAADLILGKVVDGVRLGEIKLSAGDALAWGKHAHLLTGGVSERVEGVDGGEGQRRIMDAVAEELGGLSVEQLEAEEDVDP